MKVAILLCGQLRTFNLCKWVIEAIKLQYDCDIFMGIDPNQAIQNEYWNSKEITEKNIIDDTINFVQPTQYYIFNETEFEKSWNSLNFCNYGKIPNYTTCNEKLFTETDTHWEIHKPFDDSNSDNRSLTNVGNYQEGLKKCLRQYFLVSECYKMLINHIDSTETKYDIIIRLRFDLLMWCRRSPHEDFPLYPRIMEQSQITGVYSFYNQHNINLLESNYKNIYLDFTKQDHNTLSTIKLATLATYACLSDEFWTHGMDLIEKMSTFYDNLVDIMNQVTKEHHLFSGGNIEHYFLRFVFNNNINIKKTNISGLLIREYDKPQT